VDLAQTQGARRLALTPASIRVFPLLRRVERLRFRGRLAKRGAFFYDEVGKNCGVLPL
jgi:hypothetical protein